MLDIGPLKPESTLLIDGRWRPGSKTLTVENPSTGETAGEISAGGSEEIDAAVSAARRALQGPWGGLSATDRGRILSRMSAAVVDQTEALAQLEALDVGKPLSQARADARALARYLEYYGGAADKLDGETIPYLPGYTVLTLREPLGVTGHIIPWNYPMQIVGRSVVAALAVGNAAVLKPAEEASLSALAFARIATDCGLPHGALNVVPGLGEEAGAALSSHPGVDHISFTGSGPVGTRIQRAAAERHTPVTLELGGKSAQIVFDDADLQDALPFLVNAGVQNAGQTCSAASRILVQRGVYSAVLDLMAERYRSLTVGPAKDDLDLGPLISAKQRAMVQDYVDLADRDRLEVVARGRIVDTAPPKGHYFAPALVAGADPAHALAQEEIFGPVQVIIPFDDEDHAVAIANGTSYGLVAAVWTRDGARQLRLGRRLQAGQVFVNTYGAGGGVELPFGGVKQSGFGREKGFEGLYGFTSLKTIAVRHG